MSSGGKSAKQTDFCKSKRRHHDVVCWKTTKVITLDLNMSTTNPKYSISEECICLTITLTNRVSGAEVYKEK